jgi:hypothetical protein
MEVLKCDKCGHFLIWDAKSLLSDQGKDTDDIWISPHDTDFGRGYILYHRSCPGDGMGVFVPENGDLFSFFGSLEEFLKELRHRMKSKKRWRKARKIQI